MLYLGNKHQTELSFFSPNNRQLRGVLADAQPMGRLFLILYAGHPKANSYH
jgi:hypothetical protein